MDDHEINKRLAEIAGVYAVECPVSGSLLFRPKPDAQHVEWHPLTDWSQLKPLTKRENIRIAPNPDASDWWRAWKIGCAHADSLSLKRAISMAIIAAHAEG